MGAMSDYDEVKDDPCRPKSGTSGERTLAFVLLFFAMFGGGILVVYSAARFFGTHNPATSSTGLYQPP